MAWATRGALTPTSNDFEMLQLVLLAADRGRPAHGRAIIEMSRSEQRKEIEATGTFDVRRRAEGNVYDPEKLKHAREWLYEQDNTYQRRADTKNTFALVFSGIAILISGYVAFLKP